MKFKHSRNKHYFILWVFLAFGFFVYPQNSDNTKNTKDFCSEITEFRELKLSDEYFILNARADDPLYTSYSASLKRSKLYGDKAYKMDYYSSCEPLNYESDKAGRMFTAWNLNEVILTRIDEYFSKPVVLLSFPDMAVIEYQPFEGIYVQETFFVYSSEVALVDLSVKNISDKQIKISVYPVFEMGNDSLYIQEYNPDISGLILNHRESRERLISDLYSDQPYPEKLINIFSLYPAPSSFGGYKGSIEDLNVKLKQEKQLNKISNSNVDMVALKTEFTLEPDETHNIRYFRDVLNEGEDIKKLSETIRNLEENSLQPFIDENEKLFFSIPHIDFKTKEEKIVYLSAFNLVRGSMLPPTGKTKHNFYVFSRNPIWGWGHGHQVLHESLSMITYVYLDPVSAQGSQMVYIEQQEENGLIAYRHGPRGAQTYPHKDEPTTSAPFFSWINWEIFVENKDVDFLKKAYSAGSSYMNWLIKHRDTDRDGLFEWGPYGIIENVRDWYNVIFQVSEERYLDVDKEDISDELECLDLSLMIIKEMKCLSKMALVLGDEKSAEEWFGRSEAIGKLVNSLMWDEESGFYYHIDKVNHSFKFMDRDLKRREIIGFLALWAEIAPVDRAEKLIVSLTDTSKFWRKYGIPTLSADDPWYSPDVDQCCKWNGPVWLLWNYMVFDGLVNYGYYDIAGELADKMMLAVSTQLSVNHNFWESYSPDNTMLNCPSNYIWDSIMAKLLIEVYTLGLNIK